MSNETLIKLTKAIASGLMEGEEMTTNLKDILEKHEKWLKGNPDGERADLCGANLRGANLSDTNFCRANLNKADLSEANLRGANLCRADLTGANLKWANLRDADLRGASLYVANLIRADLSGADLSGADLSGADLRWANLRKADLREADLDYSCWPLWCGSFDIKVDKRMSAQLAYHFCRLDCDDPEHQEAREALKELANQFHRVNECGRIE